MLPVHDHNARTSTQITAPTGVASILRACDASASGPGRSALLDSVKPFGMAFGMPSLGSLPRFAA